MLVNTTQLEAGRAARLITHRPLHNYKLLETCNLTLFLVSLSSLAGAERPPDGGLGSQKRRVEARRARSVQLLVHVCLDGRQPREQKISARSVVLF